MDARKLATAITGQTAGDMGAIFQSNVRPVPDMVMYTVVEANTSTGAVRVTSYFETGVASHQHRGTHAVPVLAERVEHDGDLYGATEQRYLAEYAAIETNRPGAVKQTLLARWVENDIASSHDVREAGTRAIWRLTRENGETGAMGAPTPAPRMFS